MDRGFGQGRSFVAGFTRRTQGRNLRSIVLSVSAVCWAWCIFSYVSFFRNASDYQGRGEFSEGRKLAQLSTVLGALYVLLLAILSLGLYATYSHKRTLVHTYAHLSVVGAVIMTAAGILNISYFFQLKDEILAACDSFSFDDKIFYLFIGSAVGPIATNLNVNFGFDKNQVLSQQWCAREWGRIATGNVVIFIVSSLAASCLSILVFLYKRQLLNGSYAPKAVELAGHPPVPHHYTQHYATNIADRSDIDPNYGTPGGLFPGYNPHELPANKGNEEFGDQERQMG
ncbi:hypothetical protein GALMADRAFT_270791 [Galerina marginata CBS 339.88]|uniref:Uncharacterized protein n=1 Tax=Galerina marginata (strain CBS 339.88) TaxID=685588 RepID=A0A067T051_GALM3|nr:hypothetical protein GALMADRAFT_270791 [Galerina marginata CBS 339.88]